MTKREMFEKIMGMVEDADVVEFCEKEIAALDKKNEKAKEYSAKKKAEGDELRAAVFNVLTDDYQTVADILTALGDGIADATASKVVSRLGNLIKDGAVEKTQITIPGGDGFKARRVQAYRTTSVDAE